MSAGADPGPACYGKGGEDATVTDANLVLGRLSGDGLLGGRMPLEAKPARAAIATLAERLGFSIERTAFGIIEIVVANMVRAIRTVSVERGHDPRKYWLLPFGGAGPLHASEVARALGISRFLVPGAPGILCAQGLIASDLRDDIVRPVRVQLEEASLAAIRAAHDQLAAAADAWFARELIELRERKITISFDMRYVGQNFELRVPGGAAVGGKLPGLPDLKILRARFFSAHDQYYGFHNAEDPVEIINIRLTASAKLVKLKLPHRPKGRSLAAEAGGLPSGLVLRGTRGRRPRSMIGEALKPGHALTGPAIIEQFDSTSILYPGDALRVDEPGNLLVSVHP